jgi:hypothetical protein
MPSKKTDELAWREYRGIATTDYNNLLLLARTSVEQLAAALGDKAASWERDVMGKTVRTDGSFGWVVQLEGHPWSIFLHEEPNRITSAPALAKALKVPVIDYGCGDTSGTLWYRYFEKGTEVEQLVKNDREVSFSSKRRKVKTPSANAAYGLADAFFREVDAYEPGITPDYFFSDGRTRGRPSTKAKVGNPGLFVGAKQSRPTFERIDYLLFNLPKRPPLFG